LITALLFASAASSALLIGAAIGATWSPPKQVTGVLLAFASGALISALAFDLFDEAFALGGATRSGLGLLAGAAVFVSIDSALDRYAGRRNPKQRGVVADAARTGVGWALLAAVTLDGVPENLALGTSLSEGTPVALLVAIFLSNLPEALVGTVAMRREGRHARTAIWTWAACGLLLAAAAAAGRVLAEPLSDDVLSVVLGFAGGAVLASLADTVMPEAFDNGGPFVALATTAGFFISYILAA
jgi:ZIP family zinc transporter